MLFTTRQSCLLRALHMSKPRERAKLLSSVDDDIIKLLSEMRLNFLHGILVTSLTQLQRLRKHNQTLRLLASRKVPLRKKRSTLIRHQRGGFLPLLLPVVANAVGGILGQLWEK
jgi:hypothetical protein